MRILALVLAVLVAGCFSGHSGAQPSTPAHPAQFGPSSDKVSCLRILVVDEELQPVGNASLRVTELNLVGTTGADGTVNLCGLPAGAYDVRATRDGYATRTEKVSVPFTEELHFVLPLLPVRVSFHEVLQRVVFYNVGLAVLDTTTTRYAALNNTVCGPCSFQYTTNTLPDVVVFEARWQRAFQPVAMDDWMHHIFRGGAPFENPAGDTTNRDIGYGSMGQPFQFQYPWNDLVLSPPVARARDAGGPFAFSGAMYCWGNPPVPCVNQRFDVYLTNFYDTYLAPSDYTALPPK